VSRFGSRQTDVARGEIWIHAEANIEITCCRRCCSTAHAPRSPAETPYPLTRWLVGEKSSHPNGEIPIISHIARILNNRC
jgi:hypothetical protein